MPRRSIELLRERFPGRPAFDTALSRALLHRAASGEGRETLRLYQPDDVVAFSVLDRTRPDFAGAVAAARAGGCEAVLRLAGGRAALFHAETLAFAWSIPDPRARERVAARFEETSDWIAGALAGLGVDARVGEVPGEYCPGSHSVNARGGVKLMGVGQRVVRGAAHVGGVIVVRRSDRVREVLAPVYAALGFDWDPTTAGSVEDEVGGVTRQDVAEALLEALRRRHDLDEARPDPGALDLASGLEPDHRPEPPPRRAAPPLAASGKSVAEGRA